MARGVTFVLAAVIVGATAPASASDPVKRVVLINPTPELAHAARTALAPWKIDVLEFRTELIKPEEVPAIATDRQADRIAWLADGELFVLDPVTGTTDRRPAPEGAADAPAAASVALSLKTLLRLPPPPPPDPVPPPPPIVETAPPAEPTRVRIVPEVGGSVRLPIDGTVGPQPRIAIGVGIVHPGAPRLRPSVVAGFGPAVDAGRNSFRGTFSDVEFAAQLALELPVATHWSIVPRARLAVHRVHVEGEMPMQLEVNETSTSAEGALDLALWFRAGRLSAGAGAGVGLWSGIPSYVHQNVTVFDGPTLTGQVFGIALVDL